MTTREDVFVALETLVNSAPSVVGTTRQIDFFENIPNTQFPMVFINDAGDSSVSGWTSGFMSTKINIELKIITHSEYKTNSSDLNLADREIVALLGTNLTLGGIVDAVLIGSRASDDIESTYPYVSVVRNIEISYTAPLSSGL